MQYSQNVQLEPPSLPKGGGAITNIGGKVGAVGPDGAATLALPLPITTGRGYAPSISLNYSSQMGNGPFGIGWFIGLPSISRRTHTGVPTYGISDEFVAPDGEVLVPLLDDKSNPVVESRVSLLETTLSTSFRVTTYRSRVERDFSRLEYWQPEKDENVNDFWVWYHPDGQVHLLGYEPQARIEASADNTHTAQWLLNAAVSATGEQIWYLWQSENEDNCSSEEKKAHKNAIAQRYLSEVYYGNLKAGRTFPCLNRQNALKAGWLFILVFDYGTRSTAVTDIPVFTASGQWPCRQDCFSDYSYGFDLRTRRLCRQILMFHRLETLAGKASGADMPALVSRLLLTYNESPFITTLASARQMAFEGNDKTYPLTLPPLTLCWSAFDETAISPDWQSLDLKHLNPLQSWQYLDLWGEGIAGILYQDSGAWWYRAPERDSESNNNAVIWSEAYPLTGIPSLRSGSMLIDLNGDGYLEWLVTHAGVSGHYDRDTNNAEQWLQFSPLSALPVEFSHPQAQLTDITGSGIADLVMIGPNSVRLYVGQGESWLAGQTILQSGSISLPVPNAGQKTLVAFSDPLGSGQQHLVQVDANGVTCWPNLGHGRFDQPIVLPGFSIPEQDFNPDQVYLADVDGSGAVDVIYAYPDRLAIFRNQSGNQFSAPLDIALPPGVHYDRTCQLQAADVQGLGLASLLLIVPHMKTHHYVLHLTKEKPWLLTETRNNMGAVQVLKYRSSAQFWLDEKAEAKEHRASPPSCHLPFPLHTLWRTETHDEITGNHLVSEITYRHGSWDGKEREFRGFGYVAVQDTDYVATNDDTNNVAFPSLTCSWYATGIDVIDTACISSFWSGDDNSLTAFTPRFTSGESDDEAECSAEEQQQYAFWLTRAMKGLLLRTELYGLDGSELAKIPYRITEQRLQARLIEKKGRMPTVWPSVIESRSYLYERVAADPQCSQQITLSSDRYGQPLRVVNVNYPRRIRPAINPYPDTLPETLFTSSYDEQQQKLYLLFSQSSWYHLDNLPKGEWITNLPDKTRSDIFTVELDKLPSGGMSLEILNSDDSPIADSNPYSLAGQQQTYWLDINNTPMATIPAFPPRVAFSDTATFDEEILQQLQISLPDDDIFEQLLKAGYRQADYLFTRNTEKAKKLWVTRSGSTDYADKSLFWHPLAYRNSPLTGKNTLTWDPHSCVITQSRDAAGLTVKAQYDWRFLKPTQITDINNNIYSITLDALGRVTSSRFYGTENGAVAGYSDKSFTVPANAEDVLALSAPLPIAQCYVYISDSWTWENTPKLPPHVVALTTDRYDSDSNQQIRQRVVFSDGFGRELQSSVHVEAGDAWQRTDEGVLKVGADNLPEARYTNSRWVVTGKTEYDNKGQPIRTYQPYFLDSWKYVRDDSARPDLYADTHYYDPVGREWQVKTAKGGLRRQLYTPWFTVIEDENDTAGE
ncbi:TPA: virulence protein [Klebsiella aerogenes]|nr:virulence protein [Klebsiella aerogenes]HDT1383946.1 virulence protein [Klebsiella aerogenes]HDU5193208.1 virulence protein [Klebsiella aerogenes]HDU5290673.1 virulence protein [Klebsiella aerogenes]